MNASELLAYANANNVDLSPYYDVNNPADTNWQDEVLRSGFSHNHNISINGAMKKPPIVHLSTTSTEKVL